MFIKKRESVFETNSSSAHALVVKKESGKMRSGNIVLVNGAWDVEKTRDLSFGREFDVLGTVAEKACFAIASLHKEVPYDKRGKESLKQAVEKENQEMLADILHILQKVCPEMRSIKLPIEEEKEYFVKGIGFFPETELYYRYDGGEYHDMYVYVKENGEEVPGLPTGDDTTIPDYGNIDHQSLGLLEKFFKDNPEVTLEDFLLDDRYVVIIDSDESQTFYDMVSYGILDIETFTINPNMS